MDLPFDVKKEKEKLDSVREREEEDVAQILADKYDFSYTNLSLIPIDSDALRTIPEEAAREAEAIAFERSGSNLSVAVHNPAKPALVALLADLAAKHFVVKQFLTSHKSIEKGLARYADLSLTTTSKAGVFDLSKIRTGKMGEEVTLALLKTELEKIMQEKTLDRVSHLAESVFASAMQMRASDIHFEPEEGQIRLRLRLDGLLTDAFFFDKSSYHLLLSRIKLLSGVKLNIANRAQDGRFSIGVGEEAVEIRASFIPGNYGESIVLRILDPNAMKLSIRTLGINPKLLARLEKEIRRSNGMLLTTGPTGSGKTTTLYAFLHELQSPEIKVITIEDPIEYHIEGVVQTQTGGEYTFASGLRSIVRQDPDVIMVGEIRDGETANIAIEAALTGHFVFSTLHTNNAAGTFPRLVDLGADPKSFGSAITVSMAQRLLRTLDPDHKKERATTDAEKKMMENLFSNLADASLVPKDFSKVWEAVPEGESTGYKGRMGIHEAIFMDDEIASFLRDNPPENEIAKLATKQGYFTMAQDGIAKALAGLTSLEELGKTVDLPYE